MRLKGGAILLFQNGHQSGEGLFYAAYPLYEERVLPSPFLRELEAAAKNLRNFRASPYVRPVAALLDGARQSIFSLPSGLVLPSSPERINQLEEPVKELMQQMPELFFLPAGTRRAFVLPFSLVSGPLGLLLLPHQEGVEISLLLASVERGCASLQHMFFQHLLEAFRQPKLAVVDTYPNLLESFALAAAPFLMPARYLVELPGQQTRTTTYCTQWSGGGAELYVQCPEGGRIGFELPASSEKSTRQMSCESLRVILERLFELIHQNWRLSQAPDAPLDWLLFFARRELDAQQQALEQLSGTVKGMAKTIETLQLLSQRQADRGAYAGVGQVVLNYFYLRNDKWEIKFKGEEVTIEGRPGKGLRYLHKLIEQKGIDMLPHELEGYTKGQQPKELTLPDFDWVTRTARDTEQVETPDEMESEIKFLARNFPGEGVELEEQYKFWVYFRALCDRLCRFTHASEHYQWLDMAKERIENLEFEIEDQYDDSEFVNRDFSVDRVFYRPALSSSDRKKVRERVVRNIQNAIDRIRSEELNEHLQNYIKLGPVCCYQPPEEESVDWVLYYQTE